MPCNTALPVTDADLATLYRIADGGLSPLTGPMAKAEYDRVLDEEVIERGGKKYAWTIPLAFPAGPDVAHKLTPRQPPPADQRHRPVRGRHRRDDVYEWDKAKYNAAVYGTPRTDHPGGGSPFPTPAPSWSAAR